jgi:predicted phage terminase large subunit-like protein
MSPSIDEELRKIVGAMPEGAVLRVLENLQLINADHARKSLSAYGSLVHGWSSPSHIEAMVSALERVERGESKRLIVVAPPRHGKTNWATIAFAGWYLGRHPDRRVLHVAATGNAPKLNSMTIRDTMKTSVYQSIFPRAKADPLKPQGEGSWFLSRARDEKDPSFSAYGAEGNVLGRGCDLLIVDDANTADNTRTKYQRDKLWDWYGGDVESRVEPRNGARVVIQHRWHGQDLVGKLLETETGLWEHVHFPAIDEEGRALWPEFYPLEELERDRHRNPLLFEALWQGNPSALSGNVIESDWLLPMPDDFVPVRAGIGVDLAISTRETADFTAIVTVLLDSRNRVAIPFVERGRWNVTEQMRRIVSAYEKANAFLDPFDGRVEVVGIESVQYQAALAQLMMETTMLPVVEIKVSHDKVSRAQAWLGRAQTGNFFVDQSMPVWPAFLAEAVAFGGRAEHDDMIDAISVAWSALEAASVPLMIAVG